MRRRVLQELKGDAIVARDGSIGAVKDVYFDDARWAMRYLVVDTGNWLPRRKVLISPASLEPGGVQSDGIHAALTRKDVEGAPPMETQAPVSRLYEEAHARHYRYPAYWEGSYLWGIAPAPGVPPAAPPHPEAERQAEEIARRARESHLRSASAVAGYGIEAADGKLGHVEDFVVDDASWTLAGMVVDTRDWLPGRKVLVPPSAIEDIDWNEGRVKLRLTREEVKGAPEAQSLP